MPTLLRRYYTTSRTPDANAANKPAATAFSRTFSPALGAPITVVSRATTADLLPDLDALTADLEASAALLVPDASTALLWAVAIAASLWICPVTLVARSSARASIGFADKSPTVCP